MLVLDLSDSEICAIESGAFDTLFSLQQLKLPSNMLKFFSEVSVANGVFKDLRNLEYLDISMNCKEEERSNDISKNCKEKEIYKINYISTRNELFTSFSKLHFLAIDLPERVDQFVSTNNYSWLLSVKKLIIHGSLAFISNMTFAIFKQSNVSYLAFRGQLLEDVEPMAFSHFSKLHTLNVSNNMKLGFQNISKSWYGLNFTAVQILDLTCISPYDNNVIRIEEPFFNNLRKINITDLYLSHNDIYSISGKMVTNLPNVKRIWLSNNRLSFTNHLLFEIVQMKNLVYFNVNFQVLRAVKKREVNYGLSIDKISGNITTLSGNNDNKLLQYVSTKTKNFPKNGETFEETVETYKATRSIWVNKVPLALPICLRELHASRTWNKNVFTSPTVFFLGRGNLRFIDYSYNYFTKWNGSIYFAIPPRHKITLDVSNHLSKQLSPNVLKYSCQYFDKFFLSGNRLGNQLKNDGSGKMFSKCYALTLLDLANNDIHYLPQNVFRNLSQLQYLNLSFNSLRALHISIGHMSNLKELNLSNNIIQNFDQMFRDIVDTLTTKIDLSSNALVCDCQNVPFLFWINKRSNKFRKFSTYNCFFQHENDTSNNLINFSYLSTRIIPQLVVECSSKEWLKYSITGLLAITLIFCISIFTYRHRWEIKFCLLQFNYRKRNYIRLLQQQEELRYEYAAFVSYDSEDRDWVENNVRELETAECRLFLYRSEFQLGQPIEANIMRALNVSRKTILVLSPRFVTSQWCLFEARMAFQKCIDTGIDSIIPIILEPIDDNDMPTEVKRYLTDYIYLQWPQNSVDEQREFWDKLRRELLTLHCHLAPSQIISSTNNASARRCR